MKKTFGLDIFKILLTGLVLSCTCACGKIDNRPVVKFSSWGSESEVAVIKPLIKDFESKNPDIKIEFSHIPNNYFQKLHLLIASNLAPDVIFVNNINGPVYAENGALEDLSPFLDSDKTISEKDFFKQSLQAFKSKKQLYAIPRDVSNLVVYYNKDLFSKYAVPLPKPKQSFEDFLKTAQSLTKDFNKDGIPEIYGVSFEENPLFWTPFLWSNGGGIISSDLKSVNLDKPQSIEALQFYSDLRNLRHVAPRASEQGSATMAQMFMQGKIAMLISGRWNVPKFSKDINFDWDITRFPYGQYGSIVDADASGWAISKSSIHKKEAWRFISYLASKKSSEKFTLSGLIVPARLDVAYSETFLNRQQKPKNSKIFVDIIPESVPTPANQNYQEILDIVNSNFEQLWNGDKKAKEVVTPELIKKIKALL